MLLCRTFYSPNDSCYTTPMFITISSPTQSDTLGIVHVYKETWLATYPNERLGITVDDIEDKFKDDFTEKKIEKRKRRVQIL
jgi:hypothetical protein